MSAYDDIIGMPYPRKPRRMSNYDRAAQFSPFAALTGHEAAIAETARLTEIQIELTDSAKAAVNEQLRLLAERVRTCPWVTVTWFLPDERKSGGVYVTLTERVKKVDVYREMLVLTDGREIPFGSIYEIEARAEAL